MTNHVGQQFGNYRLLRVLGQGNFAEVYLGEHRYLERPAAVKILHVQMEARTHKAFEREARTIAHLDHPHIVRVYDFGIQEQTPYLVMEYTSNGTLRMRHPKRTCLPLEQIVTYVKQIASALDYAHEHHVIHRDVKPENLLLNAKGEIVLSDFGIAVVQRTLASLSEQHIAGTPLYMAPEQIRHQPCPASDQYALAVMVYEWFCGEPPFRGSLYEVLSCHLYQAPPGLCARFPDVHPAIEKVIFQALSKDPQHRFATVQDFAQALEGVCTATQPLVLRQPYENNSTSPMSIAVPSTREQTRPAFTIPSSVLPSTTPMSNEQALVSMMSPQPRRDTQAVSNLVAPSVAQRNRQILLRKVRAFWIEGVFKHSLHGAALIMLGLQARPDAIANPWHMVLQQPETQPYALPAGTRITDAYDAANGELLILGAPGAGKTTLLLELARDLLKRAERDELHPMPVIFNLSSWATKQQRLQDWLAEELVTRYQVPSRLAHALVEAEQILPLLDGLDEVDAKTRTACIEAINTYHQNHGLLPLVVCSRQADYLAQIRRVLVRSAVVVQPLTQEQVDAYLAQGGEPLRALRVALHQDTTLRELTSTPLMLSILTLTYYGQPVAALLQRTSLEERQRKIFEQYVGHMLTRRGPLKGGTPQQFVQWLVFLAARMRERNQTVFYLEQLQPDWLPLRLRRVYGWLGVLLPGILIGILTSFGISTLLGLLLHPSEFVFFGTLGGFLGGLFSVDAFQQRPHSEFLHTYPGPNHSRRIIGQVIISVLMCLLIAFISALSLGKAYRFEDWLHNGDLGAIAIGIECLLLQVCLSSVSSTSINSHDHRTQRLKHLLRTEYGQHTLRTIFVIGLVGGLSTGLATGLNYGIGTGLGNGVLTGLTEGMAFGIISLLINLFLSIQSKGVLLIERLHWTRDSLMNSLLLPKHRKAVFSLFRVITVSYGLYSILYYGINYGSKYGFGNVLILALSNGLNDGLLISSSYWIVAGLFQGISYERIEEQSRQIPGKGIHLSLRNCILMGSISSGVIWLTTTLSYPLSAGLTAWLGYGVAYGLREGLRTLGLGLQYYWFLGLCGGLLVCLISGGIAVLRHSIIRLLLRRAGMFPRHYVRFLDEAASRLLLQKVGGGYSFVHRLLLEYFADREKKEHR